MRNDDGFSLVELTVVVLVMSIVGFMMLNFLDNTSTVVSRTTTNAQTEADARVALRSVLEDVRAAQSIAQTYPTTATCPSGGAYPSGYASCIQFSVLHTTSASSSCPYSRITYGVVGSSLKEDRVDYDASCVAHTIFTGKKIITNLSNAARPLFSFADRYGNPLSTSTSPASAFAAAGVINMQLYLKPNSKITELNVFSTAALRNNR
jgi:prepilin-type N-terminal cleavage/methylation domain-containing protein